MSVEDLEAQARELIGAWRVDHGITEIGPMRLDDLARRIDRWARRLVAESRAAASDCTNARAPKATWCVKTAYWCTGCLRQQVAESRAGALADAVAVLRYSSCTCARQIAALAAEAEPGATRCRPENHPDDCEPGAQDRAGEGEK